MLSSFWTFEAELCRALSKLSFRSGGDPSSRKLSLPILTQAIHGGQHLRCFSHALMPSLPASPSPPGSRTTAERKQRSGLSLETSQSLQRAVVQLCLFSRGDPLSINSCTTDNESSVRVSMCQHLRTSSTGSADCLRPVVTGEGLQVRASRMASWQIASAARYRLPFSFWPASRPWVVRTKSEVEGGCMKHKSKKK